MTIDVKQYLKPDILAGIVLVLTAFGISMFFEGFRDIHYAPAALCLLVFSCMCIIPSLWRGLEIPKEPAAALLFAFWFYVTLSLSWSSVPYASLVTYLVFIACPLAFFAPLLSNGRESMTKALALGLMAAIIVAAGWAVIQYAFFQDIYGPRAHHPLPSPNNLAGLINLALLPALAFYLSDRIFYPPTQPSPRRGEGLAGASLPLLGGGLRRLGALAPGRSWVGGLLALVLFAGLLATESRGGLLSAIIAAGILIAVMRPPLQKTLISVAAAAAIFLLIGSVNKMGFAGRLSDLASFSSDAPSLARIAVWKNAWRMALDHFWLGAGFGTFYLYYPGYREPGFDNSTGNWAHMDPLQYWAELGAAAPLLFYGLCFAVLIRTARAVKALPPEEAGERAAITGLFCGLFAMVLHTHADFHLYIMPILIVTGAWLALWYVLTARALADAPWIPVPLPGWQRPFMAGVTVIIAGLIAVMAVSSAAGQYHLVRAQGLIQNGQVEQFTAAIEEAERWAPSSFIDPEVQLAALYIDLLGENASALFSPEEQKHLYEQTIALLDIAESQNPPWAEVDYKRGLLYKNASRDLDPAGQEKALAALERAIVKNPMHFRARQELALLYIRQGHVEKAWVTLETGLKYPHPLSVKDDFFPIMGSIEGLVKIKRDYDAQAQNQ